MSNENKYYRIPSKGFDYDAVLIRISESQVRNLAIDHDLELVRCTNSGYMADTDLGDPYFVTCHEFIKDGNAYYCYTIYDPSSDRNNLSKFISLAEGEIAFDAENFLVDRSFEGCMENPDLSRNRFLF